MKETKFKQTEVGMIPSDWEVKTLGELVDMSSGTTPSRFNEKNFQGNVCWLSSGELKSHYIYNTKEKISEAAASTMRLYPKGTVVIAMYGLEAEGVRGTSSILAKECTISQACMAFTNLRKINNEFFYYWYAANGDEIGTRYAQGTKQQNLSPEVMKNVVIPLPPTIKEQQRIANTLSDVDALINNLEKLIAKKKNIKQGAMQQLLTGKKRLPGFGSDERQKECHSERSAKREVEESSGYKMTELGLIPSDWENVNISKTCTIKARIGWQGLKSTEYLNSGDYILVTGTDFKNGFIDWSTCSYVSEWRFKQDKNIQIKKGDVLVTKDGTIGKVAFLNEIPMEGTLNSGVFVVRSKDLKKIDSVYLSLVFKSSWFDNFLDEITSGSTIVHLYQKDFVKFNFPIPSSIEEQTAIANVLSDMDTEISALETKLAKYRTLKTGMMQQLLTGKIRLA